MKKMTTVLLLAIAGIAFIPTGCVTNTAVTIESIVPFGSDVDVAYSQDLWKVLLKAKLVGPESIRSLPYEGQEPHGVILEQLSTHIKIKGYTGKVYVK